MRRVFNSIDRSRATRTCVATIGRFAVGLAGVLMVAGTAGCQYHMDNLTYGHSINKKIATKRAKARAVEAWYKCHDHKYKDCAERNDVFAGFVAGYVNVAMGGEGCTPMMPPRKYWSWRYDGKPQFGHAWLKGYPLGAIAGEGDPGSYRIAFANLDHPGALDPSAYRTPTPDQSLPVHELPEFDEPETPKLLQAPKEDADTPVVNNEFHDIDSDLLADMLGDLEDTDVVDSGEELAPEMVVPTRNASLARLMLEGKDKSESTGVANGAASPLPADFFSKSKAQPTQEKAKTISNSPARVKQVAPEPARLPTTDDIPVFELVPSQANTNLISID